MWAFVATSPISCFWGAVMFFLVILLLSLALLYVWRERRQEAKPRHPKGLLSLPFIGSMFYFLGCTDMHLFLTRLKRKYGKVYSLYMGSSFVVVVNDYKHAKEVLIKKGKIFGGRPRKVTTDILTRDGKDIAFASYSPIWRFQRKMVHTALCMFGEGYLALEKKICREASSLCEILTAEENSPLDILPELMRAVTNVVCSLCFNSCYLRGDYEFESLLEYSKGIVGTVAKDSMVDVFPWLKVFPNKDLALLRKCVETRDKLLVKKYTEHKEAFNSNSINDLMDALIKAKMNTENNNSQQSSEIQLTDDYLLMTIADIFGAGVETTTTVINWSILYLLHYPEVQQKIQEEIDEKVGFSRHPGLEDRQHLAYLEATIHEVLRIQPVSPILIPHEAMEDTSLGEYDIPKGTLVLINLWAIHHDEEEWDKPEEFNPGRFLDADGNRIYSPSPSYLPFGTGIRGCLGESLAKMELFLFLAWILQKFNLSVPEGHPLPKPKGKFGVVLQVPEFKVKVTLRGVWKDKMIDP